MTSGAAPGSYTAWTSLASATSARSRRAEAEAENRAGITISGRWCSAMGDPGGLEVGVLVQGVPRLVPAGAGELHPAERHGHVALLVAVHPDRAGPQRPRHPVCAA